MNRILLVLALMLAGSVQAADRGWWEFWRAADEASGASRAVFNDTERRILRQYLSSQGYADGRHRDRDDEDEDDDRDDRHKHEHGEPKKTKHLPPGLRKKLERGGELPPGWKRKVARGEVLDVPSDALPGDWLSRLPRQPKGASIRRVDDEIVRVLDATGVILDVLKGK